MFRRSDGFLDAFFMIETEESLETHYIKFEYKCGCGRHYVITIPRLSSIEDIFEAFYDFLVALGFKFPLRIEIFKGVK